MDPLSLAGTVVGVAAVAGRVARAIGVARQTIRLGGRYYRKIRRTTIVSRDTRTEELQQITLESTGGEARDFEDDDTCVRDINWMHGIFSVTEMVSLLEDAQRAIATKDFLGIDKHERITNLGIELSECSSLLLSRRLTAEVEGWTVLLGLTSPPNIEHILSGPRQSMYKMGRNESDVDIEHWHLLLACWATFQTLLEVPCQARHFIGLGARGCETLIECVEELLSERSLLTINLVDWVIYKPDMEYLDLGHVHTSPPPLPEEPTETDVETVDLREGVKQRWFSRMFAGSTSHCHPHFQVERLLLDHLWRSLRLKTQLSEPRGYRAAQRAHTGRLSNGGRQSADTSNGHLPPQPDRIETEESGCVADPATQPSNSSDAADAKNTANVSDPALSNSHPTTSSNGNQVSSGLSTTKGLLKATTGENWLKPESESYMHTQNVHHALLSIKPDDVMRSYCMQALNKKIDPRREQHWRKSYIVVGWFPGALVEPIEACMWYFDEQQFLPSLKRQIGLLRGWRQVLSLKTVQAFGLYKCDLEHRCHTNYQCSPSEKNILAQLYNACYRKTLSKQRDESIVWADWVQLNLNNNTDTRDGRLLPLPFQCHRSLKLIVKWSRVRLILTATLPLALSLIIGVWYQVVKKDVQTAYTVASYIVTAGAFALALLAILTSLQDGGADLGWAFTARTQRVDDLEGATRMTRTTQNIGGDHELSDPAQTRVVDGRWASV